MTDCPTSFETLERSSVGEAFLRDGYVIVEAENIAGLDAIRGLIAEQARQHLKLDDSLGDGALLDRIHEFVDAPRLNALRLAVIQRLRGEPWFRPTYFSLVRDTLSALVGNELAMQRGTGLSVQLPNDTSSLLPIHADVWDGDSPYEVVVWVPLVDCFATKSMYIVPLAQDRQHQATMARFQREGAEALFHAVEEDARFLDVPYGKILVFSQTLMHGNRINTEQQSRWSMNCRFKSLMSPYAGKALGEFFEPITPLPATRLALDYRLPEGFDE